MTVSMTGQQWKAFYADEAYWPEGRYHDDEIILLNGTPGRAPVEAHLDIKDTDQITVAYGDVMSKGNVYFADLVEYAKEWLDKVTKTQILVQCPDDKVSAVVQAILDAGGEVMRRTKSKEPLPPLTVRYEGEIPSNLASHVQSLTGKDK